MRMSSLALRLMSGQGVALVGGMATGVLAARVWGAEPRGVAMAILAWPMGLVFFGEGGVQRSLPFLMKKHADAKADLVLAGLVSWVLLSLFLMGLWALLLVLGWVESEPSAWLWVCAWFLPFNLLFPFGKGIMLGLGHVYYLSHVLFFTGLVPLLVVATVGLFLGFDKPEDAWWSIAATALGMTAAGGLLVWNLVRKRALLNARLDYKMVRVVLVTIVTFGASSLVLNLMQMSSQLILSLPSMGVERADLANFTVGMAVAGLLRQVPDVISKVVLYRGTSGGDNAESPRDFAVATVVFARRGLLLMVFVALPIAGVAPWVIPFVYGKDFQLAGWVTAAVVPGVLAFFVSKIYESALSAHGQTKPLTRALWPSALVLVVLGVALVPLLGMWGMVVAMNAGYLAASLLTSHTFCRLHGMRLRQVYVPTGQDFQMVWSRMWGLVLVLMRRLGVGR